MEPTPAERSTFSPALLLAVLFDAGSLPAPGFGIAFGAVLRGDHFARRALGSLAFEQHASLPGFGTTGPGADLSLALGSFEACAAPFGSLRGSQAASLCGGWELGRLLELEREWPSRAPVASFGRRRASMRVSAGLFPAPLRLGTLFTLAAPLERQDFVLRDLGRVHRPSSLVGRWAVGVDVSFD